MEPRPTHMQLGMIGKLCACQVHAKKNLSGFLFARMVYNDYLRKDLSMKVRQHYSINLHI